MTEAQQIQDRLEHVALLPADELDELRGRIEALPDQLEKERLRRLWMTADQCLSESTPAPVVRLDQVEVYSPPHYQAAGVEMLHVVEAFDLGFALGNVIKYVLRADRKGSALIDLRKARFYLDREIARRERP